LSTFFAEKFLASDTLVATCHMLVATLCAEHIALKHLILLTSAVYSCNQSAQNFAQNEVFPATR
jgi:hypothetical protein